MPATHAPPPTMARSSTAPSGVASADGSSAAGWMVAAVAAALLLSAIATGRFSLSDDTIAKTTCSLLAMGLCGIKLRMRGWVKLGTAAETFSQFMLVSMLAALASVVLASTDLPFQDGALQDADARIFHVDWQVVIDVARNHPSIIMMLSYAYTTISWQPLLLMSMLFLFGRPRIAAAFSAAWAVTLAISVSIFPLVPAVGGYLQHHVARSQTHVLVAAAWRHLEILAAVRDGSLRTLNADTLEGIVTFPSFHAAAAVLLTWGFWHLRHARWPALALNVAMLSSTPFIGGHYFVDVAAGVATAILALALVARPPKGGRANQAVRERDWHGGVRADTLLTAGR